MRITDIGPKQKQRHMALIAMETTTHADGGIRDRWDSYRCTRTCYKSESCSFTAPKHDYPLPPCPIFPTCVYGAMHQIVPQFINHAASHLWRGPKRISVGYFILTICVCYVFHRACDILSRRSFNIMWEDDRANIDGTFLNIYIDDSPEYRSVPGCESKEKCWNVILRSLMHVRTGRTFLLFRYTTSTNTQAFRCFTDVMVWQLVNKSSQSFTLYCR